MYSPHDDPKTTPGSGENARDDIIRQLEALDDIARHRGESLSVDRMELLGMLRSYPAVTGGDR